MTFPRLEARAQTHSIEQTFGYETRYLAYFGNGQFEWLSDPCNSYVLKYDDDQLDEAAADIAAHGGELVSFPARGDAPKPVYAGHNAEARLARQFGLVRGATLLAAE